MKVSIVTIGDEILIGQIVDTNSAWMGQRLNEIGLEIHKIYSIPDTEEAIVRTLNRASELTDIVLITGGLGPTNDDITKKTLAGYFDDTLHRNEEVLEHIKDLFKKYGLTHINELNRQQADLPRKCKVLLNKVGTASGMWFEKEQKHFISMPGVPHEMKTLMSTHVLPELQSKYACGVFIHKTILTQGVPESVLAEILEPWEKTLPIQVKLAYLPSENRVRLRLSTKGEDEKKLKVLIEGEVERLKELIPEYIFGEEKESLEQRVGELLRIGKTSVATAESCTGGYLAHLITSISGSSDYFKGSVLAYDNKVKSEVLQVPSDILRQHGAVSAQVVREMALGVQKLMKVDYALATSGIAGPNGGTDEKPVGTVWTAIATPTTVKTMKYQFGSERIRNIKRSANAILLDFLHELELSDKKAE